MNVIIFSKTKHESEEAGEQHSKGQEVSEVHSLRQHSGPEHEEGVGEQVGGVQQSKVTLGFIF